MEKINKVSIKASSKVSSKVSSKASIIVFCALSMTACVTSGQDKVQTLPEHGQFPVMVKTSAVAPVEPVAPTSGGIPGVLAAEAPKELQQPESHNPQSSFWPDLIKAILIGCVSSGNCW